VVLDDVSKGGIVEFRNAEGTCYDISRISSGV
jgi:hypothetical protein